MFCLTCSTTLLICTFWKRYNFLFNFLKIIVLIFLNVIRWYFMLTQIWYNGVSTSINVSKKICKILFEMSFEFANLSILNRRMTFIIFVLMIVSGQILNSTYVNFCIFFVSTSNENEKNEFLIFFVFLKLFVVRFSCVNEIILKIFQKIWFLNFVHFVNCHKFCDDFVILPICVRQKKP